MTWGAISKAGRDHFRAFEFWAPCLPLSDEQGAVYGNSPRHGTASSHLMGILGFSMSVTEHSSLCSEKQFCFSSALFPSLNKSPHSPPEASHPGVILNSSQLPNCTPHPTFNLSTSLVGPTPAYPILPPDSLLHQTAGGPEERASVRPEVRGKNGMEPGSRPRGSDCTADLYLLKMDLFWACGEGLDPVTSPGGNTAGMSGYSSLRRKPWDEEHWEGLPRGKVVSQVVPEG